MKKSSEEIAEDVYLTNVKYSNKQNKTKILFFRCLEEGRSYEYFEEELSKIWDNVDHRFMDRQINKLQRIVNKENIEEAINLGRLEEKYKETDYWIIDDEFFKLTPESDFKEFEQRFKKNVLTNFKQAQKSIKYGDKETYLSERLDSYNKVINQTISYFTEKTETVKGRLVKKHVPFRKVQLSTYLSMIHNTNLTRSGWNQTMSDSEKLGQNMFIIPYHPFSCPYCQLYQNRPLNRTEVETIIGVEAIEQEGDILHPNCKCTLSIYWSSMQLDRERYTPFEKDNFYNIRQKVNSLTLEKSNLRTDIKIADFLGEQGKVDLLKSKVSVINRNIRELKKQLPNELQKQVTQIKR